MASSTEVITLLMDSQTLERSGDIAAAIQRAQQALLTSQAQADSDGEANALNRLAYAHFRLGHYQQTEAYSGDMGAVFTYAPLDSYPVSNLVHTANAGVTCSHDADLKVTCTGTISWVTIEYDFSYVVSDYVADTVWLGWSGYSNYAIEFTIHLIYPAPLTYVRAYSTEPVSVTATDAVWYSESTTQMIGYGLFQDPRVTPVYLPMVSR